MQKKKRKDKRYEYGTWGMDERRLDMDQFVLKCARINGGDGGAGKKGLGNDWLSRKVALGRNLRRGKEWVKGVGRAGG